MQRSLSLSSLLVGLLVVLPARLAAQDPPGPKDGDKEIAEKVTTLKDIVGDRKFSRDDEGLQIIDALLQKLQAGVGPKDQQLITKGLDGVLSSGKLRPPENTRLYVGAAAALGYCGEDGAKSLKKAYTAKRFPDKKPWVPLREQLLKAVGRTKDEAMVKFLCDEARLSPEAALQAAAGEALGNFEQSEEKVRKEIVSDLLRKYGELSELASQMGSANIEAQNARDRLAALSDKWNTTLAKLTKQNFHKFSDWLTWYNKNKNEKW